MYKRRKNRKKIVNPRKERSEKIPINSGVSMEKKESIAKRIRFPYKSTIRETSRMPVKASVYSSEERRFTSQFRRFFTLYILSSPYVMPIKPFEPDQRVVMTVIDRIVPEDWW